MIYKKPKNMTYTDMCIYIDEHIYTDKELDYEKIYEYLFHLVLMLARKGNFFRKSFYYEDFATYGASRVLMRLINPKQNELDENGTPKLKKIKSVLNYIKSTIYPMKVDYEREAFSQVIQESDTPIRDTQDTAYVKRLANEDGMHQLEFMDYLERLGAVLRKECVKVPYSTKKAEMDNIYLSCLLTLLNSITLSKERQEKLTIKGNYMYTTDAYINKTYRDEGEDAVILFHIDPSMHDYILVLTNKIKKRIAKDLSSMIDSWEPTEDVMKNLLFSVLGENNNTGGDDTDEQQ